MSAFILTIHHLHQQLRALCRQLIALPRSSKRLLMCAIDCLALPLCLTMALAIMVGAHTAPAWQTTLLLTALCISTLSMASLYQDAVRQLDQAVLTIACVALAGAVLALHLLSLGTEAQRIPAPALTVFWLIAMLYLIASRAALRAFLQHYTWPTPASRAAASSADDFPLEQLLGRVPVQPDAALFALCVRGKSVLVTGAGGSIGSELCRQIASLSPTRLHLLDHSEFALYTIAQELQASWPQLALRAHLGSVCNAQLLDRVLQEDAIATIYHAAAYKHVSIVETNVVEGLRNNVVGARAVASAAARHGVATCVLVSSDKAVRPSTIMGASKRLSELIFQAAQAAQPTADSEATGATRFSMVRFGNVLGSSGSVVPLFRRQLQQGGPLTITDAAMERYFMLIPEAAQLVIQAGAMASGGEVFVLDMGAPLRIVDLARRMIALAGLTERTAANPHGDIDIRYVGLFPGEKLQEELLVSEGATPSHHPRILHMTEQAPAPALLDHYLEQLLAACNSGDRWLIEAMLKTIMHEFTPHSAAATDAPGQLAGARLQPVHAS
ncbi:MAG: polysaccharide biosynthesis protein [Duganella sp.]